MPGRILGRTRPTGWLRPSTPKRHPCLLIKCKPGSFHVRLPGHMVHKNTISPYFWSPLPSTKSNFPFLPFNLFSPSSNPLLLLSSLLSPVYSVPYLFLDPPSHPPIWGLEGLFSVKPINRQMKAFQEQFQSLPQLEASQHQSWQPASLCSAVNYSEVPRAP